MRRVCGVVAAAALAGCGGGGGSAPAPVMPVPPVVGGTVVPLTAGGSLVATGTNGATLTITLGSPVPPGETATIAPGAPAGFTQPPGEYVDPSARLVDRITIAVSPAALDMPALSNFRVAIAGQPPVVSSGGSVNGLRFYDASTNPATFVWQVGFGLQPCFTVTIVPPASGPPGCVPPAQIGQLLPGHVYVLGVTGL